MNVVADSLFKDHKNGPEILSAISEVQLGANTMANTCALRGCKGAAGT